MRPALLSIQFVLALGLIVVIILQPGRSAGLGAMGGGTELFFGRRKKGIGATLARITPYLAGLFMLVTVIMTLVR